MSGMADNAIHAKYIELVRVLVHPLVWSSLNYNIQFAEFKRLERDHAKEKQKLVKDKDAGTSTPHVWFCMLLIVYKPRAS